MRKNYKKQLKQWRVRREMMMSLRQHGWTLRQIGEKLGISRAAASQAIKKAEAERDKAV